MTATCGQCGGTYDAARCPLCVEAVEVAAFHCRDPERCSICLGHKPRVITILDGELHIDGVPQGRSLDPGLPPRMVQRARRGGSQTAARTVDRRRR